MTDTTTNAATDMTADMASDIAADMNTDTATGPGVRNGAETADSAGLPVVGYTVVLPPGWVRIGLRDPRETDAGVKHALDTAFAGYGRDQVAQIRREAEQDLREQIAAAKQADGLDLYLPVSMTRTMMVPASFVVSEGRFDTQEEVDAKEMVLSLAASTPEAEVAAVDGSIAIRVRKVVAGIEGKAPDSTRVEYIIAVPQDPKRWLVAGFSTLGTDELADLLADLFDAIMSTFYWRRGPRAEGSP